MCCKTRSDRIRRGDVIRLEMTILERDGVTPIIEKMVVDFR